MADGTNATAVTAAIEARSGEPAGIEGDGVVDLSVNGVPDGDVTVTFRVAEGGVRLADGEDADVVLTIAWKDAQAVLAGVAPATAYMQGKLKASGDMDLVLALLRSTSSSTFRTWLDALAA
jgi:hypothetical protein